MSRMDCGLCPDADRHAGRAAGSRPWCRLAGRAAALARSLAVVPALVLVIVALALSAVSQPAAAQSNPRSVIVTRDWSLIPAGIVPGDQFRLLFITSNRRNATASDIDVYNGFVQDAARGGHAGIQANSDGFRAVASTEDVDARDNIAIYNSSPIYWLGGNKVADDTADFFDGSWDDIENPRDQHGNRISTRSRVWTGSLNDGTERLVGDGSAALGNNSNSAGSAFLQRAIDSAHDEFPQGPLWAQSIEVATNQGALYGISQIFWVHEFGPIPTFASSPVLGSQPDIYEAGERIEIRVNFGEPVRVSGAPRVNILYGSNSIDLAQSLAWGATYLRGSGTENLVFGYVVKPGDSDSDGIRLSIFRALDLNDGAILAVADDFPAANRRLGIEMLRVGPNVDGSKQATSQARVNTVSIVSDPMAGDASDTYGAGDRIRVAVTFDRPVQAFGIPQLRFDFRETGGTPEVRTAEYVFAAGAAALEFAYTVKSTDRDADGISILATLDLPEGARIVDENGAVASPYFTSHVTKSGHKVDGRLEGPGSANALLGRLAVSTGGSDVPLDEPFAATRTFYAASVDTSVARATIAATPSGSGARMELLDAGNSAIALPHPVSGDFQVDLVPGLNIFKIRVTALDGVNSETYTLNLERRTGSAALGRLILRHGVLAPALSASVESYAATVPNSVLRTTLEVTTEDPAAALAILDADDAPIPDADASTAHHQVDLDEGANVIRLQVTAHGGAPVRVYTVTVTRTESPPVMRLEPVEVLSGDRMFVPVVLSKPSSRPVQVTWSTADGTAAAGEHYQAVTDGSVTIPAGKRRATLHILTLFFGGESKTFLVRAQRAAFPGEAVAPAVVESQMTILLNSSQLGPPAELAATVPRRESFSAFSTWPSAAEIVVSWDRPEQVGGHSIAGYRLEVSSDRAQWRVLAPLVDATTWTHRGLAPRSTRYYRVRAVTRDGTEGPVSSEAAATTSHGLSAVEVVSRPADGRSYQAGETIELELRMTTAMTYRVPRLPLLVGGRTRQAACGDDLVACPSTASKTLRLSYVVRAEDLDEDGIAVAPDSLTGNQFQWSADSKTAVAEIPTTGAALLHPGAGPFGGHRVGLSPIRASVSAAPPVREGETATFTMSLTASAPGTVSVGWSAAPDSAAHASDDGGAPRNELRQADVGDYASSAAGVATFPPGVTEREVTVATTTDGLDEYDESFLLRLDWMVGSGAELDAVASEAMATILDVNEPPAIEVSASEHYEGEDLNFQVTLSGSDNHRARTLAWSTADGTATAGEDYTAVSSGTLTLAPGEQSGRLAVAARSDAADEEPETFRVRVAYADSETDASARAAAEGTGTILDGEAAAPGAPGRPRITVSLDYPSATEPPFRAFIVLYPRDQRPQSLRGFRIDVSSDGGTTWQVLEPSAVPSEFLGGLQHVYIHRDLVPGSTLRYRARGIADDGTEGLPSVPVESTVRPGVLRIEPVSRPLGGGAYRPGEEIVFRVHLGGNMQFHDPRLPIRIGGRTRFATCRAPVPSPRAGREHACPAALGSTVDLSYTVRTDDLDADGIEIAATSLWAGHAHGDPDRFVHLADGTTFDYHYTYSGAAQPLLHAAVGPLAAHRVEGARVSVASAGTAVEGRSLTFPVILTQALDLPVEVAWSVAGGTAAAGEDFTIASGTVTFATRETATSITVATRDDTLDEDAETLVLRLDSADGAVPDAASATGTIADNDDPPAITLEGAQALEGEALELAAVLAAPSARAVELTWSTVESAEDGAATAGSDYTAVAAGTATIAPGGLRTVLSVATLEDTAAEPDETVAVRVRRTQYANEATAPGPQDATATILDDDAAEGRLGPPVGFFVEI